MSTHLSAAAAAQRLGVSRATLYAYVSRGWVRSQQVVGSRSRVYSREDVERLAAQARGRHDPLGVARRALDFEGLPVLSSQLSLIDGGRLYYRGQDAIELSRSARFEEVASLLWGGPCVLPEPGPGPRASVRRALTRMDFASAAVAHLASAAWPEARVDPALPAAVAQPDPAGVRAAGARVLVELAALAQRFDAARGPLAARLASAFGARGPRARRALEVALILCADHELNASAFAARVAASAGAAPHMAVIAALAALSGERHGGSTRAVTRLLEQPGSPSDHIAALLRRAEVIPGFGHQLYPDGDPRAARLLELCRSGVESRRAAALAEAARQSLGVHPNVDFGLVALCRSFGLPRHAPFVLFALGRSAGWLAHILEQYAAGSLIRPRARYVGARPEPASAPAVHSRRARQIDAKRP